jgi:hypothetical protein
MILTLFIKLVHSFIFRAPFRILFIQGEILAKMPGRFGAFLMFYDVKKDCFSIIFIDLLFT